MVAVLKQIEVRLALKPKYLNRNLVSFSSWYRDNEPALGEYFLALGPQQTDYEDFHEFVLCQYDVECELHAAAALTTYGDAAEQRAYAAGDFGSDR